VAAPSQERIPAGPAEKGDARLGAGSLTSRPDVTGLCPANDHRRDAVPRRSRRPAPPYFEPERLGDSGALAVARPQPQWPQLLDGRAEDYQLGETRSMVMRYLRDYPNRTPKEIADALQLDAATIRQTCRRMAESQQLRAVGGKYRPANGDTSDSSDSAPPVTPSLLSLRHSTPSGLGEPL
jgi:hypothetical protein